MKHLDSCGRIWISASCLIRATALHENWLLLILN